MTFRHSLLLFAALVGSFVSTVACQQVQIATRRDSARVLEFLRAAPSTLRTAGSNLSLRKDAIGDSLVLIALSAPPTAANDSRQIDAPLASQAVTELGMAGIYAPNPYTGSTSRLLRVAQQSRNYRVRRSAVYMLASIADTLGGARALRLLALQPDLGLSAVMGLNLKRGAAGVEQLRLLYVQGGVTDSVAKLELERFASLHGWIKKAS